MICELKNVPNSISPGFVVAVSLGLLCGGILVFFLFGPLVNLIIDSQVVLRRK